MVLICLIIRVWFLLVKLALYIVSSIFDSNFPLLSVICIIHECILSSLLSWTDTVIKSIFCFSMESIDLKPAKFDVKSFHKFLKHITAFTHQLLSLFLSHNAYLVYIGAFKVREKQNKNFLLCSWDFYQIYTPLNIMKIAI